MSEMKIFKRLIFCSFFSLFERKKLQKYSRETLITFLVFTQNGQFLKYLGLWKLGVLDRVEKRCVNLFEINCLNSLLIKGFPMIYKVIFLKKMSFCLIVRCGFNKTKYFIYFKSSHRRTEVLKCCNFLVVFSETPLVLVVKMQSKSLFLRN